MKRYLLSLALALTTFTVGAQDTSTSELPPSLAHSSRYFEMRTYHAAPGKLELLNARFRYHTNKIFANHNMDIIGFWEPMDKEGHYENKLVYILAFASRAAHDKAWKDFAADPEWQAVRAESEKDGKLVEKVDSVFLTATDYSPIK